ncbi:NAD(P)H-dependent oxidoreductase [Rhizobium sp. CNPSo 4039]|uniref:NAD(P)H-dependent oxidoreductase n=1 Tax=Rhizobium sp. CNPSo 4039 TaxID=3021409 RepID=UPI002551AD97|nr:NAD(P)H-dependent oxidoreductase [Rhizobium sp. CNPSo 4039]MDK4716025.1 NAD(P)H-dependent oxidoreductase [Rhizobium sp. CNPSo 4039]
MKVVTDAEAIRMRTIVLFAHPAQRRSSINLAMASEARKLTNISFVDLYEEYPRFEIDVDREQARLSAHDLIVFQFPTFWYSTPAILKEYQDLVLEYGFAYGPAGKKLDGKFLLVATTTGGSEHDYSSDGGNRHPFRSFLLPLEQTASLCGMRFLPPFVLHSANHIESESARGHIFAYGRLLSAVSSGDLDPASLMSRDLLTRSSIPTFVGV